MTTISVIHHLTYILISVTLTLWVGKTLFKDGRVFLIRSFEGNESMADSVNHLLLVGFLLDQLRHRLAVFEIWRETTKHC